MKINKGRSFSDKKEKKIKSEREEEIIVKPHQDSFYTTRHLGMIDSTRQNRRCQLQSL
jgi:hypothetical protein